MGAGAEVGKALIFVKGRLVVFNTSLIESIHLAHSGIVSLYPFENTLKNGVVIKLVNNNVSHLKYLIYNKYLGRL